MSRVILDPAFERGLTDARSGKEDAIVRFLRLHSGLPGPRANLILAHAFGEALMGDTSLKAMCDRWLRTPGDDAPGGTDLEFLPLCAVYAYAAWGARYPKQRKEAFRRLRDAADDLRFRVRDAVSQGLATIGAAAPEETLAELSGWTDGFLYAANMLEALGETRFLDATHDAEAVAALIDAAFELAIQAPRSAERYPGYKSLIAALAVTPGRAAVRHGAPVFDVLVRVSKAKEPMIREAVMKSISQNKVASRFTADAERVREALAATAPVRRDPTTYVGKTRGRGKKGR
jgi:hypothetical protein